MFITCCLYCIGFVVFSTLVLADDLLMDMRHAMHQGPDPAISHKRLRRIINGHEITPHSRPYLVYLEKRGIAICGGTILDADTILTAAHCAVGNPDLVVVAGAHDKTRNNETQQRRDVKTINIHEQYNSRTLINDIAILKLASPLNLDTPEVSSLSVNTNSFCPLVNSSCRVTGWGDTTGSGTYSNVPREVNIKVISNSNCYSNKPNVIFDFNICAGGDTCSDGLYEDSCQGDSGGPFACECDGEYKVAGIVSWGDECGKYNCPGVYTRVSSYLDWINGKCAIGDVGKYGRCYHMSGSGNFPQGSMQRSAVITIMTFVFQLLES